MRKELPLAQPLKISHQFYAFPLSIIMNDKSKLNWFHSEFIQLFTYRRENEDSRLLLYNYGLIDEYEPLECVRAYPHMLKFGEDLIKLFKLYIDNEYYPYVICDDSYITTMNIEEHRAHDILLYGYDDEHMSFLAFAYNGSQMRKFHVSYKDMLKAYYSEEIKEEQRVTQFYRQTSKFFGLDLEKIKWHLLDYYEGVDTLRRERSWLIHRYKDVWGINIYDELKHKLILNSKTQDDSDPASMYLLYEHKRDMTDQVKYLKENSDLSYTEEILSDFEAVRKEAGLILNLNIKLNSKKFKNAQKDMEDILTRLDKIKNMEKEAIGKYLNYNEEVFNRI